MFPVETYQKRRSGLRKALSGGLVLFLGNLESPINYPANVYPFRQDSSFLYFFGLDRPGLVGLLDLDEGRDFVFGDDCDLEEIVWSGPKTPLAVEAHRAGVNGVRPFSDLADFLKDAVEKGRRLRLLPPYRADHRLTLAGMLSVPPAAVDGFVSKELIRAVVSLRSIKGEEEIAEIEKAVAIAGEMFQAAVGRAEPGVTERELASLIREIAAIRGGGNPFNAIVTTDGQILHLFPRDVVLGQGRLLLIDAGAESELHYASDITRTYPIGGRFTTRQREIYDIVYQANTYAVETARPGLTYREVHLGAAKVIASGLTDLGLMKGDPEEAVKAGAHALFFPHGLGHLLGLDVHDMEGLGEDNVGYDDLVSRSDQFGLSYLRFGRSLAPGMVLTVEPGCYFIPPLIYRWQSEKRFVEFIDYDQVSGYLDFGGIRLEDDILITGEGCRVLSLTIPKAAAEVEELMTSRS
ncbi:MAG: aminopeptidase P family protein [Deltaproteobacteria bacterium]|nr:aminopeptidase P family protein [Deltaproteobacteria bacterium]